MFKKVSIIFFLVYSPEILSARIALCAVATGKYDIYAQQMVESARPYFCPDHEVHYFIFTDGTHITPAPDVTVVYQKRLGWPYDTLMRFEIYLKNKELFNDFDFIFATDADMRFVGLVGDEILSPRVGTRHPGYTRSRGTYETNKRSTAYVAPHEGTYYFAGGLYGGSREIFFDMMHTLVERIYQDLAWNYIAVWHDESHLNRYFIDNPPTKILSPGYCYPENDTHYPAIHKYKKRLIAIDKNHTELRK